MVGDMVMQTIETKNVMMRVKFLEMFGALCLISKKGLFLLVVCNEKESFFFLLIFLSSGWSTVNKSFQRVKNEKRLNSRFSLLIAQLIEVFFFSTPHPFPFLKKTN